MSEQQKLFASLSGALVAHLIFFLLIFGFLSTRSANSSSRTRADRPLAEEKPREVTVLMGELMEQIQVEPPPPPAPRFVTTDLNTPEAEAPPEARFESDRNTSAASALRPDETLPQEDGPTLAGTNPLPHLTLANRDYKEGDQPSAGAATAVAMPNPPAASPSSTASSTPVGRDGSDDEDLEGAPLDPVESVADRMRRPAGLAAVEESSGSNEAALDSPEEEATSNTRKSFVDPEAGPGAPDLGPMTTEEDRHSSGGGTLAETGESTDQAKEKMRSESAAETGEISAMKPADEGLFSDNFSPEERQNVLNGSLSRAGHDAVDADETALGKYKKSVRDAIAVKWHRYKQDNADFVTWGILKLQFSVDRNGRVNNLQITKNEANAILVEFSLKAIREAKLPAMPADVAESVGAQGLVIQYDIIIY